MIDTRLIKIQYCIRIVLAVLILLRGVFVLFNQFFLGRSRVYSATDKDEQKSSCQWPVTVKVQQRRFGHVPTRSAYRSSCFRVASQILIFP